MQKRIVFGVLLVLLLAWPVLAADPIMPLSEVKPGMKGIAKTVIRGEEIATFNIKVLDILPGNKEKNRLILIKVSGPVIEQTGGIASGMSGSPVYINGRIIGAIGYGFDLSDHKIGMVTPIEDMLKVKKMADKMVKSETPKNELKPLATPLLVNGLSPRALADLTKNLAELNLQVMQGSGNGRIMTKGQVQPGSAVGVQLARGYIEAGAVGTVSYIDGDNILAFGHSFLNKGSIDFPLATAYIHQVIPNLASPFKLASNGQTIGRVLQDRTAGVSGKLNEKSPLTLVRLQVTDHDLGKTERTYFEVVKDADLAVPLITSGLLGLMDTSLDRKGKGTSKVSFSFQGEGLGSIARENMFYSDSDVAAVSLLETSEVLNLIINNVYEQADIKEIALKVDVEQDRRTATVQKAAIKQKVVKPGDKLEVEVTYLPYRGKELIKIMSVDIPKDMPEGELNLNIYGGNLPPVEIEKIDLSNAAMITPAPLPYNNLKEMLSDFLAADKNNEIIIEEMRSSGAKVGAAEPERKKEKAEKMALGELRDDTAKLILPIKDVESGNKIKSTWASHYIMEGYASVCVTVKK